MTDSIETRLPDHSIAVTADETEALFKNSSVANGAVLLGVFLLSSVFLVNESTRSPYLLWVLVMFLGVFLRFALVMSYRKKRPDIAQASRWSNYYLFATTLLGLAWASIILIVLPYSDPEADLFAMMILLGMMAAALPLLSSAKWGLSLYILPTLITITFYFLLQGGVLNIAKASVFIVFYFLLVISSLRLYKNLHESNTSIYEKRDLIEFLDNEKNLVESLNHNLKIEIEQRRQAQEDLEQHRRSLEQEVQSRTTQLITARDEAELANQAKTDFLATISHEIRTPMTEVHGILELLESTELNSQQSQFVEASLLASHSLIAIINDVLDFSKTESGQLIIVQERFDPTHIAKDVVNLMRSSAEKKKLQLELSMVEDASNWVLGDSKSLRQILTNLISNSIKFTNEGRVNLDISKEGRDDYVFVISDTGIGLEEQEKALVLQPFWQVDSSLTRKVGGTGLGLTIVKRLLDRQNATFNLYSEPSKGTRIEFKIRYPECELEEVKTARPIDLTPMNIKVLLIEDNVVITEVISRLLGKVGCQVSSCMNAKAGIETYQSERDFDVLLMDLHMPDIDGLEATRRIRAWEQENKISPIPIIATTGYATEDARQKCMSQGMNGFLAKPIKLGDLHQAISEVIESKGVD